VFSYEVNMLIGFCFEGFCAAVMIARDDRLGVFADHMLLQKGTGFEL